MTGLSGAGKSTLANALEAALYEDGLHTFLLDGDNVRGGLCSDLDMSREGRSENIRRLAEVARLMADAGLVVIVSAISPFTAERAAARARFTPEQFLSVYVSTPFAVCAQRDPKGLYRAALEGRIRDFTGLDSPYEAPTDADCTIDTSQVDLDTAITELRAQVLERCRPR
ncbi:MAG: Adenylyl-sulfate kinase [Stenotrophomonas maltophilia]|nr:MAG: Adenylyl-sulfate kinase [Stenotrophomonas maltophilia]